MRSDVRVFHKECVSLAQNGYKVHLVIADGKGNAIDNRVVIHDIGKDNNRFKRILLAPCRLLFLAPKIPAKVYHFHDPELLIIGFMLKLFTKARVIYDVHESYPDDIMYKDYLPHWARTIASVGIRILENFVARRISGVITVTDYHAERFARLSKITRTVCNYPLLSEWNNISNNDTQRAEKTICYVGNITRKRGISHLMQAIENLDCKLHLAGGYDPPEYREELCKMPAWSKVVEYGYVNRETAIEIIARSMVGIMLFMPEPNHINSLSTKVFEYMAGATSVIVSDFPVYSALIAEQSCGICVDPNNIAEISKAIQKLLTNAKSTIEMGNNGQHLVLTKYNWETQQQNLLDAYKLILEGTS
jgi:glycosyltransferase involved in cell wall biosynthesis